MKHFNVKAAFFAAITAFLMIGTTAFAENEENSSRTSTQSSKQSSATSSKSSTKSPNESLDSASDVSDEEISEPRVSENPQLKAELQNDELYEYLMKYLNDPENFKTDGSGVLISESVFDPPTSNTSGTSNSNTTVLPKISADGDKVMYTVATRDGSIFYIVIDKSGGTENVYFLNTVDLVDLASAIKQNKTESDVYTEQEADVIAKAGEETAANNNDESNSGNNDSKPSKNSAETNSSTEKKSDMTLYIVIGIVAVVVIGIAAYKKIGPGKKNKAPAFDEYDEPEEDEEEYSEDIEENVENSNVPDNINEEK